MKICLINNLYKPFTRGGAEIIAERIADGLRKRGHNIFIITSRSLTNTPNDNLKESRIYRLRLFNITSYFNLSKLPTPIRLLWHIADLFDLSSYYRIKNILKKEKPDLVLTHNLKGVGGLSALAIKKNRVKHIHTLHDIQLIHPSGLMLAGEERKLKNPFVRLYILINRILLSSPDIVISPSKWLMKMHDENYFFPKSKKIIIPNPINIKTVKKTTKKNTKPLNFLYAGQIEASKGLEIMISAFLEYCSKNQHSSYQLKIVGGGSKLNYYKKSCFLKKNIIFLGKISNFEVLKIMSESDVIIVPSICYENSPTVIYEGLSMEIPIIASRIGGITDIIRKFGGLLFQPNNSKDLLKKIEWLTKNYQQIANSSQKNSAKLAELNLDNYLDKLLSL